MLTAKELKKARKNNWISFYDFRGGPHYTAEQVQQYIDRTYLRAKVATPSDNKNPLPQFPKPLSVPALAGMTPELVAAAVELINQRIAKKPRSS